MRHRAIVFAHFGPYHFSRCKAFAESCRVPALFVELYAEEGLHEWLRQDTELGSRFVSVNQGSNANVQPSVASGRAIALLESYDLECVAICGYSEPVMRKIAEWAKRAKVPVILMFETNEWDRPRNLLSESLKGYWVRRYVRGMFAGGRAQARYAEKLLGRSSGIAWGYDAIDNRMFQTWVKEETLRRQGSGKSEPRHFIFVGRFAPEKGIVVFLRQFAKYVRKGGCFRLRLVGSGPLHAEIVRVIGEEDLSARVEIIPFRQPRELAGLYAQAGALVLPSAREPWGLVVNEALAVGIPVVVSMACGSSELVLDGLNGYVFSLDNLDDCVDKLFLTERLVLGSGHELAARCRLSVAGIDTVNWGNKLNQLMDNAVGCPFAE